MISFDLDLALRDAVAQYGSDQIYVLADQNTAKHCLPTLLQSIVCRDDHILVIPAGEQVKTLSTVEQIWQFLIREQATRHSLLLNVGGGVITDLGGFAAATFKRGIAYMNIPTTLLAAVDAATGGKTGFNYNGLKNEIGLFQQPYCTAIHVPFLNTLPRQQFLSGYAEMLKHALIASPLELVALLAYNIDQPDEAALQHLIQRSIDIKSYIVEQDPEETGLRKTLNLGHTIGHALESYSLRHADTDHPALLHGYAVMYGILAELYLSYLQFGSPEKTISQLVHLTIEQYGKPFCACKDYDELLQLMQHDKKNEKAGQINFTLLRQVGNPRLNQTCTPQQIREALDFLFNL